MGHGHHHHDHDHAADVPEALNLSVPDSELSPADVSRRGFLRGAGLLGAGAAASVLAAPGTASAHEQRRGGHLWLAGDHHIHTIYSNDGKYRVIDQVRHSHAYGLDWIVITDHGNLNHSKIGVEKVNPDIVAARRETKDLLVFQGLEWNIPSAEHGTVFVHPGANEVAVLKEFETNYDGSVTGTSNSSPANEALAVAGIQFLGDAVRRRRVESALFLANHPARRGVDSPHEIRAWRDADPSVAVGMEGAPGHQAAGFPPPVGGGRGRGLYEASPSANSFPGYPLESYRTWGGFDWMTSTVGGLWDSLLAEGKPWWITANSDAHQVHLDLSVRGPGSDYATNGFMDDPAYTGRPDTFEGDFWPGYYSRTHVGTTAFGYRAVMDGIRAGRIWVDHGGLISGLDVRVFPADRGREAGVPLGGVLRAKRGTPIAMSIDIDLANTPNWAQFIPVLARVDVIRGAVTGPVPDADTLTAPATAVVKSFEVGRSAGKVSFRYALGSLDQPYYVRLRGTDGKRGAAGFLGAAVDPTGPAMDVVGDADPWADLWFYANPIWVLPS